MSRQAHHKAGILKWPEVADKEFPIYPKDLNIVWGNDSRYWRVPAAGTDPAELIQVSWLEVSAVAQVEKNKKYRVEFEVEVKQDGFGWNNTKVLVMAKAGKTGRYVPKQVVLGTGFDGKIPSADNKLEIEMGSQGELYFGLYEVWSGKWKGGLLIKSAKLTKI